MVHSAGEEVQMPNVAALQSIANHRWSRASLPPGHMSRELLHLLAGTHPEYFLRSNLQ